MKFKIIYIAFFVVILQSCNQNQDSKNQNKLPLPEVSVIHPKIGSIHLEEVINGQVLYLDKTIVNSPISGYIIRVNTSYGEFVKKGQTLYEIQTEESRAINGVLGSNSNGVVKVKAPVNGYVNLINNPDKEIYVNKGAVLLSLVQSDHFVIQANVPFELASKIQQQKHIDIELPDNSILKAYFDHSLPNIDPVSQTQSFLFRVETNKSLPENLNVSVKVPIEIKKNVKLVPVSAVLTNETQDQFWVMKFTKDSLAVKLPVQIGLANRNEIEILHPNIDTTEKIIVEGAFGLEDSTKVRLKSL